MEAPATLHLANDGAGMVRGCTSLPHDTAGPCAGRIYQVRDFVSLGIDVDARTLRPPAHPGAQTGTPILFARGKTLLCGIGGLKGLIYTDRAIIFENPQRIQTATFAQELSALLREWSASAKQKCEARGNDGEKAAAEEPDSAPLDADFEMLVVEKMLQTSCDSFDRRYVIYERMLQHLTADDESNDAYKLQRLVPLRDSLQQFSVEINESREALLTLLDNEQDMLDLLLTKRESAAANSATLELELHDEVELMLEYYVRVLNRTYNDVAYLQYKLNSKRELASIALGLSSLAFNPYWRACFLPFLPRVLPPRTLFPSTRELAPAPWDPFCSPFLSSFYPLPHPSISCLLCNRFSSRTSSPPKRELAPAPWDPLLCV